MKDRNRSLHAPGRRASRSAAWATSLLAGLIAQAYAQQAAPAQPEVQTISVTGFRGSLTSAANAKRLAVGLTDSIFAEDMGKFPDANIAESVGRIPGVTVTREITGEGLQIQIRGLGTNFTRVLLNGAPVASASTGRTDAQGANREVDLDFLPTDLFTKLTVTKSPTASMLEGGAAGVVDMRSARPFDKRGLRGAISLEGTKNDPAAKWGNRGSAMASNTWGGTFGILAGVSWAQNKVRTTGFETIGWTNANLSATQSTAANRNATGGGNWTIPANVPANAGNGLTTGAVIDQAFLLANNPGANIGQIDNGLIPRLGRQAVQEGTRDRSNAILSVEYRPTDDLDFYVDSVVGRKRNRLERTDINWVGRNGSSIPLNLQFDRTDCSNGCVVTKGTFANAQFFLEYRPFNEDTDFYGVNPGFEWRIGDKLTLDGQLNVTQSKFHRESPTVGPVTPASSGLTVSYDNTSGTPQITSNVDLNNPANYVWNGGRVNLQEEKRDVKTTGARFNLNWGDTGFSVKAGAAYDDVYRRITSLDNTPGWQNAICGNNLSVFLPAPNTTNPGGCNGASAPGPAPAAFTGYGTGYTAGATTPLTYLGSLVPAASLKNYLYADPRGFVGVDFARIAKDSNYDYYHQNALVTTAATNTGANPGYIQEKVTSIYVETSGRFQLMGSPLRYNAGVRYTETKQIFGSLANVADPRNASQSLGDGGRFPNIVTETLTEGKYNNTLPSLTAAYNLRPDIVLRASASRSMTRPNPSDLRATALNFSDPSASQATLTNSSLKPYISDNIDIGAEWYTGKEGYVSAAYFSKDIQAFTAAQNTTVPFGSLTQYGITYASLTPQQQAAIDLRGGQNQATVVITQQVNSDALLKVKGLELTWVQPLDVLLPFKGLGFNANYTRVLQRATGNSGFVATGVAPYTYNVTGYYENHGLTLRLSQTFTKGSQTTNSPQNSIAQNNFATDYKQLDFSSRLEIGQWVGWKSGVQLSFDIANVTKEKQRSYFQFENAPFTIYDPGRTYSLGVRAQF